MKPEFQAGREEIPPPQRNFERSRPRRRLVFYPALLALSLLLAYGALHVSARSAAVRERLEKELSRTSGHDVRIASLRLSPSLEIVASGVLASRGGEVRFQAETVVLRLLPWDLAAGTVTGVRLEKPRIYVALDEPLVPSAERPLRVSLARLNIADGEIVLGKGGAWAMKSVFVEASNVNLAGDTGVRLRARVPAIEAEAELSLSGVAEGRSARLLLAQQHRQRPVFAAELDIEARGEAYRVRGSGKADGLRWEGESIDGTFDLLADLDAEGDAALSLKLELAELPPKLLPFALPLRARRIDASLKGAYSRADGSLRIAAFQANSDSGTAAAEGRLWISRDQRPIEAVVRLRKVPVSALKGILPAALRSASYAGTADADLRIAGPSRSPAISGSVWAQGVRVAGERFAVAELAAKLPLEVEGSSLRVRSGRVEAKKLSWGESGGARASVASAGAVLELAARRGAPLAIDADFRLRGGSFASADESRLGEHLEASGQLRYTSHGGRVSLEGEARIDRLEILWNRFFGDFQRLKPRLRLSGVYEASADKLWLDRLSVSLDTVGSAELRGALRQIASRPDFSLAVAGEGLSLGPLYDSFVRDTLGTTYPLLGSLALSGKGGVALSLRGAADAFEVEGALRLEQGAVAARSGEWQIGPLELELPFSLSYPRATAESPAAPRPGRLRVQEVRFPATESGGIDTTVLLWNNALRLPEPVRFPLFGGTATLEGLFWRDLVASPRDVSFSLSLSDLDLLRLTEALGWHRFGGTLSATIPDLRWQQDALRSDGVVVVDLFGGRATFRGIAIERPLSPLRSIETSVTLENIDLEQASSTFAFGRISGILRGTVSDLVVTHGQPARFRADLHTVPTRGVDQWISVEALNQITVLSSGNEAGALYGGLAGFFDFFRYSKLGFKAELRNDRLRLRGIESRDGQEYLVVGTFLPPTVNVISHTQTIGFSELLRRLERIREPAPRSETD
jgi:hypothetical protein